MPRTLTELATETMRMPGWLSAQEEADSQDAAHILRNYASLYAEWTIPGKEKAYWPYDQIPDEVFYHICRILADLVGPSFGDPAPVEIDIVSGDKVSMGVKGMRGLTRILTRERSGVPITGTWY
jgi:hypothetical protein